MKKIIEYTFEGKKELGIVGKATPLKDDLVENALNWIHDCYDCYYKEDFEDPQDDNPFNHLQGLIDKLEE